VSCEGFGRHGRIIKCALGRWVCEWGVVSGPACVVRGPQTRMGSSEGN
jgi:hypothetical protein